MDRREQHILSVVDTLADDIVDFTSRLVSQPSTLGNEQSALVVMEDELLSMGLSPVRVPIDTERLKAHPGYAPVPWEYDPAQSYNVVAGVPAAGAGGKTCLLNGHLDVVSPEPLAPWETDPFEPVVKNGWMHGRGAGDMKSGVAAMTYALHAVRKAGFGLNAEAVIEAVIDEECCGNGALACLDAGYDADAVLIPEPFGPTLLTNQVGVMWFKVVVHGKPTHVLDTEAGANAIERCHPLMQALRELERELNDGPRPVAYASHPHPLNLNIGIIKGGDWPSTVPAEAEFHCRLSWFPGQRFEDMRRRVEDCVSRCSREDDWLRQFPPRVEFYGFRSDGHSLPADAPMLGVLGGCHKDLTGMAPEEYNCTCTTDLRAFTGYGRGQGTCYGPVAQDIHGSNERVNIESIVHTARAYALFLARWCGLAE